MKTELKQKAIQSALSYLKNKRVYPTKETNKKLEKLKTTPIRNPATLEELLKRPEINFKKLKNLFNIELDINESTIKQLEIEVKYSGYV